MEIIDLTLSDSDGAEASEGPSLARLTDLATASTSGSAAEGQTGPVVVKEESSTGPEVVEGPFPSKRHRDSGRPGSPTKQKPMKRAKNSARKSVRVLSEAQRQAWQGPLAGQAESVILDDGGHLDSASDNETHEAAMQRAAAARRRSSSRKPSPTKDNAVAGPGPQTLSQRRHLSGVDLAIDSAPSRPNSSASSRPATPPTSNDDRRALTSAFQSSDEPGSWGHAVPMVVKSAQSRPTSRLSSPAIAPGSWGNAVPMVISQRKDARSTSRKASQPTSEALKTNGADTLQGGPAAVTRKGPTWATSAADAASQSPLPPNTPSGEIALHATTGVAQPADDSPNRAQAHRVAIRESNSNDLIPLVVGTGGNGSAEVESDIQMSAGLPSAPTAPAATEDQGMDAGLRPLAAASEQEVAEAIGDIEDGVGGVSLERQAREPSDDSIEFVPEEIGKSQAVFRAQSAIRQAKRSAEAPQTSNAVAGPSKIGHSSSGGAKEGSPTSSSSASPTRRQSARLAGRTETPVYEFKRNTYSPIKWRKAIEREDSDSDRRDGRSRSSTEPTSVDIAMPVDVIDDIAIWPSLPVDSPPPPDRMSKAVRHADTRLIDQWNKEYPRLTSNPGLHRLIFESYISECVQGAEPTITVHNNVDAESVPPNFEFQYSNDMLYHAGVPEPELGLGCDCEGPCNDRSKTCSCLKRQRLFNYGTIDGPQFAYERNGKLKHPNVSIWECGPNCGCPPECMNRVIQRGRSQKTLVDLFKTAKKGWGGAVRPGVRARERIQQGTFLGIYSGELITEHECEKRGMLYKIVGRTYLFDCDGWQIGNPPEGLETVDSRLAELAANAKARATQARLRDGIDDPNDAKYNVYSVDAFHHGNFTRFFNHSCDPNLAITQAYVYDFHPERPILAIFARRDVRAGEELCISYKGLPDEPEGGIVDTRDIGTGKPTKKHKNKTPIAKTTTAAHQTATGKSIQERCYCGTSACDGIVFETG